MTIRLLSRFGMLIVLVLLAVAVWIGWNDLNTKVLVPFFGEQLSRQIEKRFGLRLNYRSIDTNLFTRTDLYRVRLEPVSSPAGVPASALLADKIHLTYTPLGLLRGKIRRLDVEHCRIQLGKAQIALAVLQTNDLLVVSCPEQRLSLHDLSSVFPLPKDLQLQGLFRIEGEFLFKNYRPHLMQARLSGNGLRINSRSSWNAKVDARFELNGPLASPSLEGTIVLNQGVWRGMGASPAATLYGKGTDPLELLNRFPGRLALRLTGENFWIQTDRLHAKVHCDLTVHKEKGEKTKLGGGLQSLGGNYTAKGRRFEIREGSILFLEKGGPPLMDALVETKIKRYKIFASVHGTLNDSTLRLFSKPELSRGDILSLLTFERTLDRLEPEDREQVIQQDAEKQALNILFMGRAEGIASKFLGVDEINVNVSETDSEIPHAPIESVEIGKYVIQDKLFGSYKLEPGRVVGEMPKHSIGADYQFSEDLAVGVAVGRRKAQEPEEPEKSEETKRAEEEALVRFQWRF